MSQWSERIRQSPVWANTASLGQAVDQATTREGIEPQSLDGLERVRTVLAFAGKRLAASDPSLVYPPALESFSNSLQSALSEVQAFIADGNAGRIVNANSHLDGALSNLAAILPPQSVDELQALSDAAAAYRSTLQSQLSAVRSNAAASVAEVEALKKKVDELATEVANERQRLASITGDFQSQFSTAQDARGREFTDAQTSRQERYAAMAAEQTEKLSLQISEMIRQREAAQREAAEALTLLRRDFSEKGAEILAVVEGHKRDVEKLVGVIGNLGVTSGYLKNANQARTAVWIWQAVTVLALGGLIGVAWRVFVPTMGTEFSWPSFAGRALLSVTVGVLAAYAASQADKYLQTERRHRKLALELEALGPYIAALPEEKQEAFRLLIGEKSFGRDEAPDGKERSPATVLDLLKTKEVRDFIADIVKAAK